MSFAALQKAVFNRFNQLSQGPLFVVDYDRYEIFQQYLDGFTNELRQEHNCNCCKSFIRQIGGTVGVDPESNTLVSVWDDLGDHPDYNGSLQNLKKYVKRLKIARTFDHPELVCGTKSNYDKKRDVQWGHFYVNIPRTLVSSGGNQSGTTKAVLENSIKLISLDAISTVLELIDQNSLYRGTEFKNTVLKFRDLAVAYDKLPAGKRDNFCWLHSTTAPVSVSHIKNSAIGTLLENLTKDMDLDEAVRAYEKIMAPANYKRPNSLVTPKMVADAKEKLEKLGLLEAINRRYAKPTDLIMDNVLFVDKSSDQKDIFDEISKVIVSPKTLSKVEEISIDDFVAKIVPTSKSIEVLVENRHSGNFVTLLTSDDNNRLFKWNNNFSWDYSGNVADSVKERVKAAGGKVDGILRVSLSWFNTDDLDLHCREPQGTAINFMNKLNRATSGHLDVDMNVVDLRRDAVENIVWTDLNKMEEGKYQINVCNFRHRESKDVGYSVQIECNSEVFDLDFATSPRSHTNSDAIYFEWTKKDGVKLDANVKTSTNSKEKWGIKTNTFVKVKQFLLSPNYWKEKTGNKHYMFMLENCVSDEKPRGFFNEFLADSLAEHRKVFEILGSRAQVTQASTSQLSGLGFSETQRNSVFVRVEGAFKRTLKVVF